MWKLGFIGAGNMGSALLSAAALNVKSDLLAVADLNFEKTDKISKEYGCTVSDNSDIAKNAEFIFLGVKPQVIKDMLNGIKPLLKQRKSNYVLVSMAAGVKCSDIESVLGFKPPIIRIMPNTPVAVKSGTVLYFANESVKEEKINEFLKIMDAAGKLIPLEEELFDAGCAISGCGPAFVYMFINALIEGGKKSGLSEKTAKELACNTVIGSAKMVISSEKTPDTLKTEVCSPGGCTIEGVYKLEDNHLEDAVIDAVNAAYEKSKILGK